MGRAQGYLCPLSFVDIVFVPDSTLNSISKSFVRKLGILLDGPLGSFTTDGVAGLSFFLRCKSKPYRVVDMEAREKERKTWKGVTKRQAAVRKPASSFAPAALVLLHSASPKLYL